MTCCLHTLWLQEEVRRSSVEDSAASSGEVAGCSRGNRLVSCPVAPLSQIRDLVGMWWAWEWSAATVLAVLHNPAHCAVIGSYVFLCEIIIYCTLIFILKHDDVNVIQRLHLNYWLITWPGWKFCSFFLWTFRNASRQQKSWKCKTWFIYFFKSQIGKNEGVVLRSTTRGHCYHMSFIQPIAAWRGGATWCRFLFFFF